MPKASQAWVVVALLPPCVRIVVALESTFSEQAVVKIAVGGDALLGQALGLYDADTVAAPVVGVFGDDAAFVDTAGEPAVVGVAGSAVRTDSRCLPETLGFL